MIFLFIVFYWVVCGLALLHDDRMKFDLGDFLICMVAGGVAVPAKLIHKVIK